MVATLVSSIERRVSISVDTSGWAARRSHHHQAASTTAPPARHPTVAGDAHPQECPCVIARSIVDSPAARPTAPSQSIDPAPDRGRSGTMVSTMPMTSTVKPVVSQNTRW